MNVGFGRAAGMFALAGLLAACGTMSSAADAPSLDGTSWRLASLPGRALIAGSVATLQFAEGRLAGSDGCNRYSGSYATQGSALQLASDLASTQMACAETVMEQARAYTTALTSTRSYRVVEDRLDLLSADGTTLAKLTAVSQSLPGTSWRVTGINNGRQAVASVVNGTTVTMTFGEDGKASGSAGCNRFSAPYKADGSKVAFGTAMVTRMMCADPAGVMEQERNFLQALPTVATFRIEGDHLELRTAEGALAIGLLRKAPGP